MMLKSHFAVKFLIANKYAAYHFAGGKIYLNVKESQMMLARAFGLYEVEKTLTIRKFLNPGSTFVDVGGNKGDYALIAAKNVTPSGKVLCFEPEPSNYGWIQKSIELNGYDNIQLFQLALSDGDGEAQLYLGKNSGQHTLLKSRFDRNRGIVRVAKRSLDSILSEIKVDVVDMMKIDVEGAELEVLRGGEKTLLRNRDIVLTMDIHPQLGVDPKEVYGFLTKLGFSIFKMCLPYNLPVTNIANLKEILAYRQDSPAMARQPA